MKKSYESPECALLVLSDGNEVIRTSGPEFLGTGEKGVFDDEIFG